MHQDSPSQESDGSAPAPIDNLSDDDCSVLPRKHSHGSIRWLIAGDWNADYKKVNSNVRSIT